VARVWFWASKRLASTAISSRGVLEQVHGLALDDEQAAGLVVLDVILLDAFQGYLPTCSVGSATGSVPPEPDLASGRQPRYCGANCQTAPSPAPKAARSPPRR
jgi:hypothetical protein